MKKSIFFRITHLRLAILTLAFFTLTAGVQAQSGKTAGIIRDIKAELPERQKQIAEKCGGASIVVDVDFASFGDSETALLRVPQMGLKETANGFRRFCTDSNNTSAEDAAKVNSVKTKVKKILIKNVTKPEQKKISLQPDGVVLIEMAFETISGGIGYIQISNKLGEIL